jgi:KipI family sensor histidine kinase inhibitor
MKRLRNREAFLFVPFCIFIAYMNNLQFFPLSEFAILLSFGNAIDQTVHEQVMQAKQAIEQNPFPGFIETVPAYTSLTTYYNPSEIIGGNTSVSIHEIVKQILGNILKNNSVPNFQTTTPAVEIPVCYDEEFGIDLQELSELLQLSKEDIIQLHSKELYKVFMMGFTPGFAYMGKLNQQLFTNRKIKPRLEVPPGSVAIAGNQTGIYPLQTPGGWNIIGRTPLLLLNKEKQNPFLLKAGDHVKFIPITKKEFESISRLTSPSDGNLATIQYGSSHQAGMHDDKIHIQQCGFLTTLQDTGRVKFLQYGIGKGGVMDFYSMQLANAMVGNMLSEVVLEITQSPHVFHFTNTTIVAFTGGGLQPMIDGQPIPFNHAVLIEENSTVEIKQQIPGYSLYMAIAGGMHAEKFANSSSTNLLLKTGGHYGRPLQKGDQLILKNKLTPAQKKLYKVLQSGATIQLNHKEKNFHSNVIRVMEGIDWSFLSSSSKQKITSSQFTIGMQSNRMGYRLTGELLQTEQPCEIISSAVTQGTVQLTPSGEMIVLMADAQTIGGYPRILQVAITDLPILAQKKPGDRIQFQFISLQEAEELYLEDVTQLNHVKQLTDQLH